MDWPAGNDPNVAYLVGEFPMLSETFIAAEIADHVRAGLDVGVFSFGSPPRPGLADLLDESFRDRVTYLNLEGGVISLLSRMMLEGVRRPASIAAAARCALFCFRNKRKAALRTVAIGMKLSPFLARYQILHCHFGPRGIMGAAAVQACHSATALVTTFHGYDVTALRFHPLGEYYAPLIAKADLCLAVNSVWHHDLISAGFDPRKVRISHMGVDTDELFFNPRDEGTPGYLHLAMVGRLTEKKGHIHALEALAALRARRPNLAITLDVVGDGPLQSDLDARIAELSLGGVVRMIGPLDHHSALETVARADAFLLPSVTAANGDMEGIPVSLMEAMAIGRPVISTRHSGIPELVEADVSGLLATEGDSGEVARAIERLADDPALRVRLVKAARLKVEAEFDAEQIGIGLRQQYAELVRQAAPVGSARGEVR